MLQGLPAARIRYQGETWPWAAPRWRGTAGDVQGELGHPLQLLIPVAYQVLQNGGPLPARRCPADPFPFGAWPVPADAGAMVIPAELSAAELLIGTASSPVLQALPAVVG